MRPRRLKAELIAVNACCVSNLSVILHGSVHHHKVRQECPQIRNCPLHDSLLRDRQTDRETEDPSGDVDAKLETAVHQHRKNADVSFLLGRCFIS